MGLHAEILERLMNMLYEPHAHLKISLKKWKHKNTKDLCEKQNKIKHQLRINEKPNLHKTCLDRIYISRMIE